MVFYIEHLPPGIGFKEMDTDYCKVDNPTKVAKYDVQEQKGSIRASPVRE